MTSATFAAAFLSFSGALLLKLLNMFTSVFAGMQYRKGQGCRVAIEHELNRAFHPPRAGKASRSSRISFFTLIASFASVHVGAGGCDDLGIASRSG
jgi:hypothetical protein